MLHVSFNLSSAMTSPEQTQSAAAIRELLRRLVASAAASPTIQEGLYRAYTSDLAHLVRYDDGPRAFQSEFRAIVAELRTRLGFDDSGNVKIRSSTLRSEQAATILSRLEALASSAEHAERNRMMRDREGRPRSS
jgi:hypothetical protein